MKKKIFLLSLLALLVVPAIIYANSDSFYLQEDEVYNANLYRAGTTLDIAGEVNGDVYLAGQSINISGHIRGDVIAAGEVIKIDGIVDGNIRVAGRDITIGADVKRSVTAVGQSIFINDDAKIGATVLTFGQNIEMRGSISGNLDAAGETIFITGDLTHTNLFDVDNLKLSDAAEIRGNLNYTSYQEADIAEGTTIGGIINYEQAKTSTAPIYNASFFWNKLLKLLRWFLIGLLLLWLVKGYTLEITAKMKDDPAKIILWGVLFFVVTPLVAIVLMISVIGIPLALMIMAIYVIALYIAKIFAALLVGQWVSKKFNWSFALPWQFLLGLVIYLILVSLPWIGGALVIIALWWGLGGMIRFKYEFFKGMKNGSDKEKYEEIKDAADEEVINIDEPVAVDDQDDEKNDEGQLNL
ncbi:MAG: hypothetical protein AUJ28_00055 [Parcubacteria group bacterium CG1_02_37_51]|uniref:DUF8173 domain-containing protein n=2 Tax=Candidatus Komeiliibacteriota TaxID=1817908 RepID=A0A2M8DRE5_9BACT|nr:MAG: hypothetical protein AUJ28_00055 [Parcubacteria group bacterium CG1_02_37_51]PIY93991.1 MAG: hypothetical protein COY67_03260 [Candidatus Komeilibacteria bacterium CG_4_10_14_0_8_um_filter_37_78]PJC01960.1 MAG: hypothetical protein CO073_01965 [Candidatus Komeilibacteria bacterium CG_4_9_14_0_8_um_filter_36_9]